MGEATRQPLCFAPPTPTDLSDRSSGG
eukprot:COSAG04_NODE_20894_length_384_cov_0.722807_1_plen_26_part_10